MFSLSFKNIKIRYTIKISNCCFIKQYRVQNKQDDNTCLLTRNNDKKPEKETVVKSLKYDKKTLILLIDFHNYPILNDNYTNELRYTTLHSLLQIDQERNIVSNHQLEEIPVERTLIN